jgi:hypothetical protein
MHNLEGCYTLRETSLLRSMAAARIFRRSAAATMPHSLSEALVRERSAFSATRFLQDRQVVLHRRSGKSCFVEQEALEIEGGALPAI